MKDIDFDELDRAVSSLMKTVPGDEEPETVNATQVASAEESAMPVIVDEPQPESIAVEPMPVPSLDVPVLSSESDLLQTKEPEPVVITPRSEAPLAPTPQRGRFMDVMRPSSARDVKKIVVPSAVSRQGLLLQPMAEQAGAVVDQSDTLEQSYDSSTTDTASLDEAPAFEDSLSSIVDDPTPLSSPFLADAKVEKRPLGRPTDGTSVVDLAAEFAESIKEPEVELLEATGDSISPNKDAQLPEQPLPAELGSELLSIETSTENLPSETQPEIVPEVEPLPASSVEPTSVPIRSMEVTSIPQQYKVQPQQSEEAPAGAIYDTQPLAHPAESKPAWLWVAVFLAILALGAGAGAAVYYLGLL